MPALSTALLVGGGLAAAGNIGAAAIGAGAASDAAEAQMSSTDKQIALQKEMFAKQLEEMQTSRAQQERLFGQGLDFAKSQYGQAREDLAPVLAAQKVGLSNLQGFADENNPYYQAQRNQATQAIQRQLASQGLLRSKQQGEQLAGLELGLLGQRMNVNQFLGGLQGAQGQAALSQGLGQLGLAGGEALSGIAGQYGANVANLYGQNAQQLGTMFGQQGQIAANKAISQGQALSGMFQGLGNIAQGTIGNMMLQDQLKKMQLAQAVPQTNLGMSPFGQMV
jgi:hypothetical protein